MDAANAKPQLRNVQRSVATDFGWRKRRQDIRPSSPSLSIRPFVFPFFLHSSLHPVQITFDPSLANTLALPNLLTKDGSPSLDLSDSLGHFMSLG
jgi:hypothetical protein